MKKRQAVKRKQKIELVFSLNFICSKLFGPSEYNACIQCSVCWQFSKPGRRTYRMKMVFGATLPFQNGKIYRLRRREKRSLIYNRILRHFPFILRAIAFLGVVVREFWFFMRLQICMLSESIIMPFAWTYRWIACELFMEYKLFLFFFFIIITYFCTRPIPWVRWQMTGG